MTEDYKEDGKLGNCNLKQTSQHAQAPSTIKAIF